MKLRNLIVWLVTSATASYCGIATAQGRFYIGGAMGQADMKEGCNDVPSSISCDKTDTGFKLFGGYQFTPNWGAEVEYADFGKTKASGTVSGLPVSAEIKVSGFGIAATGTLPLGSQFDLFGKLGLFHGTVDSTASVASSSGNLSGSSDKPYFGVGGSWNFASNWAARLEWAHYDKVGDEDKTGTSNIDLYTVGIVYKF